MKFKTLFISLLLGGMGVLNAQTKEAKVLFIGLDGTRSDALQQANTPTIDSLMANGISTFDAWHMGVTVSGPSWSNMLTGVNEAKHKITNNSYTGADYNNWPYLSNRVKEDRAIKAVQIITWNSMDDASKGTGGNVFNAKWDLSIDVGNQGQDLIRDASIIQLQDPDLDFLFAYIQDADGAGHGTGFSLTSPAYINAIENNDAQIKAILKALKARPTYNQEEWLIVCSTDHGGLGFGHGGNSDQERHIWWFASAPFLKTKVLTGSDPGSYQMPANAVDSSKIELVPKQTDVAVTIIDHLLPNLDAEEVKSRWNLDGKSWLTPDNYDSTKYYNQKGGIKGLGLVQAQLLNELRVYPNPVAEVLNVDMKDLLGYESVTSYQYQLVELNGNVLLEDSSSDELLPLSVDQLPEGLYLLRIEIGSAVINRKVMIQR